MAVRIEMLRSQFEVALRTKLRVTMRRLFRAIALTGILLLPLSVSAQSDKLTIADPFIELRTGPGSGYPVFYVEERDSWIRILSSRAEWFKVATENGHEGWVHRDQLERTFTEAGAKFQVPEATIGDFSSRRWELGLLGGDFNGATVFTVYSGYIFTPNLSAELLYSHAIGDYSSNVLAGIGLLGQPFPKWRISPFFTLGAGLLKTEPRLTLVQSMDREDTYTYSGVGIRSYITRRFIFRAEYKNYVAFTSRDENEEVDEWKAGFAVFF